MDKVYLYYWYHHGAMPSYEYRQWVSERINAHDWHAFCTVRMLFESDWSIFQPDKEEHISYFPDHITVFEGDESVDCLDLTEETFQLIDDNDYEHG